MAIPSRETGTSEQFAARELVRSWAAGSGAVAAGRDVEQGRARRVAGGLSRVWPNWGSSASRCRRSTVAPAAPSRTCARWSTRPPPPWSRARSQRRRWPRWSSSAPTLLEALASGERTAGVALTADVQLDDGRVSGTAEYVLGADAAGVLLLPAGDSFVLVDAGADGVTIEPLKATDFSRPLARVVLDSAPAEALPASAQRVADLAATVLAAEAAGLARWTASDRHRLREGARAVRQADRQFPGHQAHVRRDAAALRAGFGGGRRRGEGRHGHRRAQLSIAAAVAAAAGIDAAKANAKDCIQVLGGIGITWEHDAHLYLRRAYGIAHFLGGAHALAAPRRDADAAGCAPRSAHRSRFGRAPAARNRRGGSRSRRTARGEAAGRPGRRWSAGAALADARTAARPARPSSCSSIRSWRPPAWCVRTW